MRRPAVVAAAFAVGLAAQAPAQEGREVQGTYVIGVTAALTGPSAGSHAPAVDGLRIFIDRLNAAGSISGRRINLVVQDDSAEPQKAAANARTLVTRDRATLIVNASPSSTHAAVMAEARIAGVPLLFASAACPKEVFPPAHDSLFCTTAFASAYDSRAAIAFIREVAREPARIGLAGTAVSRGDVEAAERQAAALGMAVVGKAIMPSDAPDHATSAARIKDADWVISWAPWDMQVLGFQALRRLGWSGDYLAWAHPQTEGELKRIKDQRLHVIGANALFADNLPIHKEITDAVRQAGGRYPPERMTEGWIAGMVIEETLRRSGWPATPNRIRNAMQNLRVGLKGLRGGPIEWAKDNHFRLKQHYRVYRWDGSKVAVAKDWFAYDVKP